MWQRVSFEVVDNKIVRVMEGRTPIEFPLNEISFIGESRSGLTVRGGEPLRGFVIPRAVNQYGELRQQLSDHCQIVPIETKIWLLNVFPLILIVALYALLLTAKNANLVLVTGAVALLFLGWATFGMRKTLAKTRSPKLLLSAFILSWLVLLWLVYQRFSTV